MIHIRSDYNQRIQDSANLIPADEPVFILRAQDKHAPATVAFWAHCVDQEGDFDLAIAALDHAIKMLQWQRKHGCKSPDSPSL